MCLRRFLHSLQHYLRTQLATAARPLEVGELALRVQAQAAVLPQCWQCRRHVHK